MRIGVYGGSFDPPTKGHLWMIKQGSKLFEKLVVIIAINPEKKPFMAHARKLKLLGELVKAHHLDNVEVIEGNEKQYLATQADRGGAKFLLRGVRNGSDLLYEQQMRQANSIIAPNIETVFLLPPDDIASISSSMVRGLIGFEGWEFVVKKYLPRNVFAEILNTKSGLLSCIPDGIPLTIWHEYKKDERCYHNLVHIADMLEGFYKHHLEWKDEREVLYAIWYHDFVYDTHRKDNEEKSAEQAAHYWKAGDSIEKIRDLIMATKYDDKFKSADKDCKLFRELDLAILDATGDEQIEYEWAIRQEYHWVPEGKYNKARMALLKKIRGDKK